MLAHRLVAGTSAVDGERLVFGAVNRDPARFSDPDRFDITRDLKELRGHLGFGGGIHACLGASMARRIRDQGALTRHRKRIRDGTRMPNWDR